MRARKAGLGTLIVSPPLGGSGRRITAASPVYLMQHASIGRTGKRRSLFDPA
jgi:hypothetical protein